MSEPKKGVVPRLRFPEFRNAGPWEVKRLGEVCDITMGASPPSSAYNDKGVGLPLLQGNADIRDRRSAPRIFTKLITKECYAGDILLSVRAPVGAVAKSCHHACIGRGLCALRANNLVANQEFIYQWLLVHEPRWGRFSQGGTFDAISSESLRQREVPIANLTEQQRIADCLSSLDEVIELQAQKLEALKAYKKGLMQRLFPREGETTPRLRFPEFRNAGPWEVKRLGDVVHLEYGSSLPDSKRLDGAVPVIGSNGIVGYHNQSLVAGPTIVIGRKGSAGQVTWIESPCYPIDTTFYVTFNQPSDVRRFIYFLLVSLDLPQLARAEGVPGLNRDEVEGKKVGFPSVSEQQKIADCLSSLDEVIELQAQKLEALKAHKKGLMQQLFPQEVDL